MADWTWLVSGSDTDELTGARARKLSFRRRGPAMASFTLNGRDPVALLVEELISDVTVWRNGTKLLRGRVAQTTDDIDDSRKEWPHTSAPTVGDYRALLDARILYDTDTLTYPASDAGVIASAILDAVQARDGGDLGITAGVGIPAGTIAPDVEFEAGQSAAAAIDAVAGVDGADGGFDWEVDADLALNIYPGGRGQVRSEVLEYGGSVVKVSRILDPRSYANVLRLSGASMSFLDEVADISTRPEGRWETQLGDKDIVTFDQLLSQSARRLDELQTLRPSWTVTLKPGWWEGPDQLWLGDTCPLVVRSGRLDVNVEARVEEVSIVVDDNGSEQVSLTLDLTFDAVARRLGDADRRLRDLERV